MNAKSSVAPPALSTVIASQADKTVTGTYALQTISSYSRLRQKVTTTITATTTRTQGLTGVETGVAVILAGGVTWALIGKLPFTPSKTCRHTSTVPL